MPPAEIEGFLVSVSDERVAELTEQVAALRSAYLANPDNRTPSKAHLQGGGRSDAGRAGGPDASLAFFVAVAQAKSRDAGEQAIGKAALETMGSLYVEELDTAGAGKATLGTSGATGGFIMPNYVVDRLVTPAPFVNFYHNLMTVVTSTAAPGVSIPYRAALPTRATITAWGQTKDNVDLAYLNYSATFYTMARIHDVANQLLRYSQGAAEEDVTQDLGVSLALGERYYVMSGAGTTEPYGILTALAAAPATFTSSFSPTAATLAGSVAKAIATCAGALAARNRIGGLSAVMSGVAYAEMVSQGTDTAGFFFAGLSGPTSVNLDVPFGTLVSPWGVPVYVDSQLADDQLVVAQFKAAKLYIGANYRLDTSTEAGTRWDTNLTGFRAEMDLAFDGRPAVAAGAFQQVTNLLA